MAKTPEAMADYLFEFYGGDDQSALAREREKEALMRTHLEPNIQEVRLDRVNLKEGGWSVRYVAQTVDATDDFPYAQRVARVAEELSVSADAVYAAMAYFRRHENLFAAVEILQEATGKIDHLFNQDPPDEA